MSNSITPYESWGNWGIKTLSKVTRGKSRGAGIWTEAGAAPLRERTDSSDQQPPFPSHYHSAGCWLRVQKSQEEGRPGTEQHIRSFTYSLSDVLGVAMSLSGSCLCTLSSSWLPPAPCLIYCYWHMVGDPEMYGLTYCVPHSSVLHPCLQLCCL